MRLFFIKLFLEVGLNGQYIYNDLMGFLNELDPLSLEVYIYNNTGLYGSAQREDTNWTTEIGSL